MQMSELPSIFRSHESAVVLGESQNYMECMKMLLEQLNICIATSYSRMSKEDVMCENWIDLKERTVDTKLVAFAVRLEKSNAKRN